MLLEEIATRDPHVQRMNDVFCCDVSGVTGQTPPPEQTKAAAFDRHHPITVCCSLESRMYKMGRKIILLSLQDRGVSANGSTEVRELPYALCLMIVW
jgi:hypothetical protein